jgi:hypothetical protein
MTGMHNTNRFFLLLLMGFLAFLVIFPGPASAINVVGAKYMETVSAGDTVTHTITISTKATDPPMDIVVDVRGFGQTKSKSYSSLSAQDDTSPYSARKFIALDNGSFHLNPGESRVITATIALPKNIGEGGRYAIISLHNAPSAGGTTAYITAISIPVIITIAKSTIRENGSISGIRVGEIVSGQPVRITTSLENTGNIHYYQTKNTVTLSDSGGNLLGTADTEPSTYAIIPTCTVDYAVTLDKSLAPGTYGVKSEVRLGDGTLLDSKTTSFLVNGSSLAPPQVSSTPQVPGPGGQPVLAPDPATVLLSLAIMGIIGGAGRRR